MKKLLAALTVVAYICIASAAMAASVKAPKEICLEVVDLYNWVFCLAVKSVGSVKLADNQKLQHYTISGSFNKNGIHSPISGTGYMDSSFFRFHISGQYLGKPTHHSIDGYVNLAAEPAAGAMSAILTNAEDGVTQDSYSLAEVPCSGVSTPADAIPLTDPAESMYGN